MNTERPPKDVAIKVVLQGGLVRIVITGGVQIVCEPAMAIMLGEELVKVAESAEADAENVH